MLVVRRGIRWAVTFLAVGFAVSLAVCWLLALFADYNGAMVVSAMGVSGDEIWSVTVCHKPGSVYVLSERQRGAEWGPHRATGPPDSGSAESSLAWCPARSDGGTEWLLLEYPDAVVPVTIEVHENHGPGALARVSVIDDAGRETVLWEGTDPTPTTEGAGVSSVHVAAAHAVATRRVKLYLDIARAPGWNEIDAVGIIDDRGRLHWATRATASSAYGATGPTDASYAAPAALAPAWSRLHDADGAFASGVANVETRAAEARGWPFPALWAPRDPDPTLAAAAASVGSGVLNLQSGYVSYAPSRYLGGGTGPSAAPPLLPPGASPVPVLPWRPVWGGLVLDTLVFGVLAAVSYWVLAVPRRFLREVSRLRRGCCIACGYQLNYDFARGCPECGWRRAGTS